MGEVYVVDSQVPFSFAPPQRSKKGTYIFHVLLGLVIIGVITEGVFIYLLYHRSPPDQKTASPDGPEKQVGEQVKARPDDFCRYSDKPAAFVHGKKDQVDEQGVMKWQTGDQLSVVHNVSYFNGSLQVEIEGHYYIFFKVYFSENCSTFRQRIMWNTTRLSNQPTVLMQNFRHSCPRTKSGQPNEMNHVDSSYLGGVFKLYENDRVYGQVNNPKLVLQGNQDNFFGLFMV